MGANAGMAQHDSPAARLTVSLASRTVGSFDPVKCLSWHDDGLVATDAAAVLIHESLHASSTAGSWFHLAALTSSCLDLPDGYDRFGDHISFHESLPKALDLITGLKTSHYTAPRIVNLAALARDIVATVVSRSASPEKAELVLTAIYKAVSDCVVAPDSRLDAEEILRDLATHVESAPPNRLLPRQVPSDISYGSRVYHHYRGILARDLGRHVADMSMEFVVFTLYYALGHACLRAPKKPARLPYIIPSVLNLLIPEGLVPHVGVRFDRGQLWLASTTSVFRQIMPTVDPARTYTRRRKHRNVYSYVYLPFMDRVLRSPSDLGWFAAYFNEVFATFPGVLINLFDCLVRPGMTLLDSQRYQAMHALMQSYSGYDDLLRAYVDVRRAIWEQVAANAPYIPLAMCMAVLGTLVEMSREGSVTLGKAAETVQLILGNEPLARISMADASL